MNELQYLVEQYPNKQWNWYDLSYIHSITYDFVEKHFDKPWHWYKLSCNTFVSKQKEKQKRKLECIELLSCRKSINLQDDVFTHIVSNYL
jgi:hypothetical protein